MAHKIDMTTGQAAFVSYQQTAWHGLGEVFQTELTAQQALQATRLNFIVHKSPNIHRLPDGTDIISTESFFTYRDDTMGILGTKLGAQYTPLQNIDAFNFVDDILTQGNAIIESAGALNDGKRVFITLKMSDAIMAKRGDTINQYIVIANSHDGSLAITALVTNVRVVCNNTLTAAMQGAKDTIKVRHTVSQKDRLQQALRILGVSQDLQEANKDSYSLMSATHISKEDMLNYFGNLVLSEDEIKSLRKGKKYTDAVSTRKQNIIQDMVNYANTGVGQDLALSADGSLNMYYAYNAVTGWATSKKYKDADYRTNSLLFGNSKKLIDTAADLAVFPDRMVSLKQQYDFNLN